MSIGFRRKLQKYGEILQVPARITQKRPQNGGLFCCWCIVLGVGFPEFESSVESLVSGVGRLCSGLGRRNPKFVTRESRIFLKGIISRDGGRRGMEGYDLFHQNLIRNLIRIW